MMPNVQAEATKRNYRAVDIDMLHSIGHYHNRILTDMAMLDVVDEATFGVRLDDMAGGVILVEAVNKSKK